MLEVVLTENGFTDKEAKIYLAVLEAGETLISRVAAKTLLKRTTVYSIVDDLQKRGIVTIQKRRGLQFVSALPPQILVDRFKRAASMASDALPQLVEMAYASPLKPRIRFYEGMEGMKQVLREFTYSDPEMVFTDYEKMPPEMFSFIRKELVPYRRKKKKFVRLIAPDNAVNRRVQQEDNADLHYAEHRLVRFPVPASNPIEFLLYGSKIGVLSFTKDESFGMIIDSPAIHNTLKNLFLLVWDNAIRGKDQ